MFQSSLWWLPGYRDFSRLLKLSKTCVFSRVEIIAYEVHSVAGDWGGQGWEWTLHPRATCCTPLMAAQEGPALPERPEPSAPGSFTMAPRVLPTPPPSSTHLLCSGYCLQEEPQAIPLANPELMNPRNLLPVNSHFFGVLVRTTGIRAPQAGHLLRGARFSPQEKSELPPRPHSRIPFASIPCSYKRHYLSNPYPPWLAPPWVGAGVGGAHAVPPPGCFWPWVPRGVPSSLLPAKGAGPWGEVGLAGCGWALSTRPSQQLPEHTSWGSGSGLA